MKPTKLITLLLALVLCIGVIAPVSAVAGDRTPYCLTEDGAAFGSLPETYGLEDQLTADALYGSNWVNCAVSESTMRTLLNQETLHPQKTGWLELDQLIDNILSQAGADADTYTKLRYAYDYLVKNVVYSWEGYSFTTASVTAYNSFTNIDYTAKMTYEEGLQKSIPDDMANRTYHILKDKQGVCYDYAIAIAVIARYIGIESYVHTGLFIFEPYYNYLSGHHGWSLLILGGEKYVFDPQRDARNYQYNNKQNGYYFGIPYETAINQNNRPHYQPDYYDVDKKANAERDASMLSITANRAHKATVNVSASEGGTVQGGGTFITGETTTVTATPNEGFTFLGWYDPSGTLLSQEFSYSFTIADDLQLEARFEKLYELTLIASRSGTVQGAGSYVAGSIPISAKADQAAFLGWYSSRGTLISTEANYEVTLTKNTTLIAMFEGDVFYDLPEAAYYTSSAMVAYEAGLIRGMNDITFSPTVSLSRGMLVTILYRISGETAPVEDTPTFSDVSAGRYYTDAIAWATSKNIVQGFPDGTFLPNAPVTREQMVAMFYRFAQYQNRDTSTTTDLSTFPDTEELHSYSKEAVSWAVATGLIQGTTSPKGAILDPQGVSTRAQAVTVIERYCQNGADSGKN